MRNVPDNLVQQFEVDRVYFFFRDTGDCREFVNFIRYGDGSASLQGALDYGYEERPEAWRSALKRLETERFRFHSSGPILRFAGFPADESDPLSGARRWAFAIKEARPSNPSANPAMEANGE